MLSRVYIDNYRCFVNFTFKPAQKQLVLGVNGAGKSAFLDALRAVRDFADGGDKVHRFFNEETRTRWDRRTRQSFELEVTGNGGTYVYTLWVEVQDGKPESRVIKETLDLDEKPLLLFLDDQVRLFDDRHEKIAEYPFDADRSALSVLGRRRASSKLEWFKLWLNGLLCLHIDPSQMGAETKGDNDILDDYEKLCRMVRPCCPGADWLADTVPGGAKGGSGRIRLVRSQEVWANGSSAPGEFLPG